MDVHPPEHPIRPLRDFGMAILTVTCGIIIALGLESALQSRHDRAIAESEKRLADSYVKALSALNPDE
jgi:hypothetical protein